MIESVKNEKIKQFVKLSNSKRVREFQNVFVIEGVRAICEALEFGVKLSRLFLTKTAIIKIKSIKENLLKNCKFITISDDVAKKMSCVEQNQGCFAIAEKLKPLNLGQISTHDCVLMLVKVNDPGNVGTLIRSACAFNFNKVILADCCDIYNPKVVRSSMSFLFKLQFLECSCEQAEKWLKSTNLLSFAATASPEAIDVSENVLNSSKKSAINTKVGCVLLIGNEGCGLPKNFINFCSLKIKINMFNNVESLNAAVAGSILMFKLSNEINSGFSHP